MKKPFMRTIMGFSGRDFILIILFQLHGFKTGLFEGNLFWMGQYYPLPPLILNIHNEKEKVI